MPREGDRGPGGRRGVCGAPCPARPLAWEACVLSAPRTFRERPEGWRERWAASASGRTPHPRFGTLTRRTPPGPKPPHPTAAQSFGTPRQREEDPLLLGARPDSRSFLLGCRSHSYGCFTKVPGRARGQGAAREKLETHLTGHKTRAMESPCLQYVSDYFSGDEAPPRTGSLAREPYRVAPRSERSGREAG